MFSISNQTLAVAVLLVSAVLSIVLVNRDLFFKKR
jgi:hypothetical protein